MPFLELKNFRVHYELTGPSSAPVLVLSNSLGTNVGMWCPQMDEFAREFRVLTYDTRGHGRSAVTPGPYTVKQLAGDIVALLDALKIPNFSFCGLSLGGMIGMHLGVHVPERLKKLVLCNTAPKIGVEATWNSRISAVEKGGMAAVTDAVLERWFTPQFRQASPAAVTSTKEMLLATPTEGYVACCAAVRDMDQREEIRQIQTPTLIVAGTEDPVTTTTDAKFMAESIPGAEILALKAAHLSNIEAAQQFTAGVMDFLRE